jgi:hypothetical protein
MQDYVELAHALRFSRLKTLLKIYVPSIMPYFFSGARLVFGFGWSSRAETGRLDRTVCRREGPYCQRLTSVVAHNLSAYGLQASGRYRAVARSSRYANVARLGSYPRLIGETPVLMQLISGHRRRRYRPVVIPAGVVEDSPKPHRHLRGHWKADGGILFKVKRQKNVLTTRINIHGQNRVDG